ncbi:MAG: nuclear transport factor 2 family protein [Syntrophales bacterium LBB04]|nr:nuclear transport factor 2 family protein [Syntrophales bacterium LBB04]
MVAHDFAKVMTNYSDRYLNSGRTKGEREGFYRQVFGSITSFEITITDFVPAGDRAYLTGFVTTNLGTIPIIDTSIIKENGQWKWFGNQRDVAP